MTVLGKLSFPRDVANNDTDGITTAVVVVVVVVVEVVVKSVEGEATLSVKDVET